jgi:hypothetical protein
MLQFRILKLGLTPTLSTGFIESVIAINYKLYICLHHHAHGKGRRRILYRRQEMQTLYIWFQIY